jgi:hypothetical protein
MATVYGVVSNYIDEDYIVNQTDYTLDGGAELAFSTSASGTIVTGAVINGSASATLTVSSSAIGTIPHSGSASADLVFSATSSATVPRTIFGGSIEWQTPSSWETWLFNEWNGGIASDVAFSTVATGTVQKNASASVNIVSTTDVVGGFLQSGSGTSNIAFSTSASGIIGKFGNATANLTVTATASGDDFDFASATANIAFSGSATADLFVGGTATPSLTFSATGSAILVIRSVNADGNITLSATAEAGVVPGADPRRIFVVDSETRAFLVLPDSRVTVVPSETRIQKIFEES